MGMELHAPFEIMHDSVDEADAGAFDDVDDGLLTNSITADIPSLVQDFVKKPKNLPAGPALETNSAMVDDTIRSIIPSSKSNVIGKKRRGKKKTVFEKYTKKQEENVKNLDQDIDKLKEEKEKLREQKKPVDEQIAASLK